MPPEEPTIIQGNAPAAETPAAAAPALPATAEVTLLTPSTPAPELPVETVVEPVAPAEPVAAEVVEPAKPEGEKPAEEPKVALHTDTPSLMEEAGKKVEPKAADKPETKPAEPAETFKYEAFKLPEGVPVDEARINAFTEIVGPHKLDQETAQKLVDLHTTTMQEFQNQLVAQQHAAFAETRRGWVDQIKADPILGGAGHQTALQAAARMRDLLVPEAHRAEFADFMRITGAGDHPALMRLLHNAARLFDEPAAPPQPARPVPDRGGSAKPSKGAAMYDHPSSRRAMSR
jgi:hypothetical protein